MTSKQFSATAIIDAPADETYAIIADYHQGHPNILPRPPFTSLEVEQGGVGAGTVALIKMRVLGRAEAFRTTVTEPEPGRVLVEANDTGYVTTFTIEPTAAGQCEVTISTTAPQRSGLLAAMERFFVAKLMRPVFVKELELLEEVVKREISERSPETSSAAVFNPES